MAEKKRVSLERLRAAAAAGGPASIEALAKHDATMAELREHEAEKLMATGEITIAMNGRGSATAVGVDLLPHREDVVATWLRKHREELKQRSVGYDSRMAARYDAIDELLDEYRLRADLGLGLTAQIPEEEMR